jgi:chromate transporter
MTGAVLLLQIALRIGGLALVAVGGGNALIPALHDVCVTQLRWLTDARFAESVGLAQVAPGPNMLLIPLIGWQTAGLAGATVALAAFLVPSSIVAIVGARLLMRNAERPLVRALRWALRPVTAGLMLCASVVLIATAQQTWPAHVGLEAIAPTLVALVVAVASTRIRVNPLVWLATAALLGALV